MRGLSDREAIQSIRPEQALGFQHRHQEAYPGLRRCVFIVQIAIADGLQEGLLPERLLIGLWWTYQHLVGTIPDNGVIGLELGSVWARLGAKAEGVLSVVKHEFIKGTIRFPHKKGGQHTVSVDGQTFAAATRLG